MGTPSALPLAMELLPNYGTVAEVKCDPWFTIDALTFPRIWQPMGLLYKHTDVMVAATKSGSLTPIMKFVPSAIHAPVGT